MHEYHDLLTYNRMNPGKNPQDEYHRRFTSPGAYRTGMMIHPTNKDGLPTTDEYELFFVPEHYLLQLMEQVRHLSSQITVLVRRLPKIAAKTFVLAMLMDEIKATNEQNGWTTVIKKRPKKRCLSQQGKEQLNLQAIFQ